MIELTWKQFVSKPEIAILSESDQMRQFRLYLDNLSNQISTVNKGRGSCLILQEDKRLLLQEDGNALIWCF